jgi:hypothetical protein
MKVLSVTRRVETLVRFVGIAAEAIMLVERAEHLHLAAHLECPI